MSKKGQARSSLVNMLVVIAGFIVLAGALLYIFAPVIFTAGDRTSCQNWVDLNSRKIGGAKIPLIPQDSPCYSELVKFNPDSDEELYAGLADEVTSCGSTYRWGKKDFYSDWEGWGQGKTVYCRVCSEIEFKDDVSIDIQDFSTFAASHQSPILAGQDQTPRTYLELFTDGDKIELDWENDPLPISLKEEKGKDREKLYVFYATVRDSHGLPDTPKQALGDLALIGTTTAAGVKVGLKVPGGIYSTLAGGVVGFAGGSIGTAFKQETAYSTVLYGTADDVVDYCGQDHIYYKRRNKLFGSDDGLLVV